MRRSIATVSLSGTLPEKLDAIAAARFDGVEIFENDLVYFNGRPQDVRRMVADLGLMARDGADMLPIPANYYDDLLPRYDLAPDFAQNFATHNILFDRVGEGTFLHFYAMPFEDRFFFEIVQRTGGYDLYGAPNAPVRMAALAHARPADLLQMLRW